METDHGIDDAIFRSDGTCWIFCICGESFVGDLWQIVGAEFDDHLKATS